MVAVFRFLFGQVTCDATGQVLCLGPEYRAQLSIVLLHPPPPPHTKKDYYQELLVRGSIFECVFTGWLFFSRRWQPVARANRIQDNAESVSHLLTVHTVSKISLATNNADLER